MEDRTFVINGVTYTLYQAASKDWCVSIDNPNNPLGRHDYNVGDYTKALEFILSDAEYVDYGEEE